MAQGARTRVEPIVATWKVPRKGVINSVHDTELPNDALFNASNVEIVDGYLRGRYGMTAFTAQLFASTPTGAMEFWQNGSASWIILTTLNKVWTLEIATSVWTDRSGTLTATIDEPASMTEYSFGTPLTNRVFICNGKDTLKLWKPGDATVSVVSGTPPIFKDITTAADRIIGLVGSHAVQWNDCLPADEASFTWPDANTRILAETPRPTTAIMNIGTLGAVIYKRDSIWVAETTGLAGASAFRFSLVDYIDGPAGPNAIVNANGQHIYMTRTGRIGAFNGVTHKWLADGVWPIVKAEIDRSKPNRVHAVWVPQLNQVRFFYQRSGQAITDGLVIFQMPVPELGISHAAFPGRMYKSVTAGCATDNDTFDESLLFTNNGGAEKTYKITGLTDDGAAVTSYIQTGMNLVKELEVGRALALETFIERNAGYGSITAKMVSSNILNDINGTLSSGSTIDLTATPVKTATGFDVRGRFLGLRLDWTSAATVKYRGAALRGQETL